ncbi:hypothetical protein CMO91_05120 [Candidatus Woesearchaeota archaeon]|nr:hypothetical protein [Candidatus Woesearchaeota archaeon]|tara:strand:- start:1092 stop:1685 length:594 start_codon:yes stop_codon:yes gene_type:complete
MKVQEITQGVYTPPRPKDFEVGPSMIKLYKYGLKMNDEMLEHAVLARFVEEAHIQGRWVGIGQNKLLGDIITAARQHEQQERAEFFQQKEREEMEDAMSVLDDMHAAQAARYSAVHKPRRPTSPSFAPRVYDPLAAHIAEAGVDEHGPEACADVLVNAMGVGPLISWPSPVVGESCILIPHATMPKNLFNIQTRRRQ